MHGHIGIHVRILKEGKMLSLSEMESQYKNWILNMHSDFDEEVDCSMDEEFSFVVICLSDVIHF